MRNLHVTCTWVFLLLSVSAAIVLASGTTCPAGQFGQDCEYRCNCADCHPVTGVCDGPCDVGWHDGNGRPCQKRNVALQKPSNLTSGAVQSPASASQVVDGNRSNSCIQTDSGFQYVDWTVDLGFNYAISSIFLLFKDTDHSRLRGISVSVYLENSTWYKCYQQEGTEVDLTYIVDCHVTGSVIRVANSRSVPVLTGYSDDAHLDLCEVEVYECSNGTYGQNCSQQCHCQHGTCDSSTGECLDSGECRHGWMPPNYCTTACVAGKYGPHCSQLCGHCKANQTCDHVTGACPNGCAAGWKGAMYSCHEACNSGKFGENCKHTCGSCKNGAACNTKTGACPDGCAEGFTGTACLQTAAVEDDDTGSVAIPTTGVVGAVAGGGILLMCCVCVAAQIRKKRRKDRSKYKKESVSTNGIDPSVINPFAVAAANASKNSDRRKSSIFSGRKKSLLGERKSSVFGGERKKSIFAAVFGFARDEDLSGLPVYSNSSFLGPGEDGLFASDKDAGVPIDTFRQYVYGKRRGANSLENEFKSLPTGFTAAYDEAERIENRDKNRFSGFYPYDFNRVTLRQFGHGDYVNASYIKDYRGKDTYVAAQAPCKKTVSDFWHMIWQENIRKIVMLTSFSENGKIKCDRYWSENGCVTYDDITIKDTSQTVRATYTTRSLKLIHKKTSETREVKHFHYTEWQEHAIPLVHDLLEFIWRVKATPSEVTGPPMLVHCSTGSGRTGTYIAVDSLLQQAEDTGRLDVKTYVERLRHQRKNMVATKEQYAFLHAALIDGIILGDTRISSTEFCHGFRRQGEQLRIGYRQIGEQFHELSYLKSAMAFRRDSGIENVTDLRNMNCNGITMQFVPSTLSANMFRLVDADEDTDVQKFMVLLRNINAMTVVCLHEQDYEIITRCLEWTRLKEEEMAKKEKERLERAADSDNESEEEEDDFYRMQELSSAELCPNVATKEYRVFLDDYEEIELEVMSLSGWTQGENLFPPSLTQPVITMVDHISSRQSELGCHPVVILVGEVQESAGLFCVVTNIGHAIQQDDEVEVYSNVCRVRRLMPDIITTVEEFMFCHEFAANYVETEKADFVL